MSQNVVGTLLGQITPANTTAATLYTAARRTEITRIMVCNTSGSSVTYRIFHDDDGTTYDTTSALWYDKPVATKSTHKIIDSNHLGGGITVSAGGSLGIRTDSANDLTFTAYGIVADSR